MLHLDKMVQEANLWLQDICEELGMPDRQRAYHALRGVLFTLRDRLPVPEVLDFAAQLPTLIRGVYFEGYTVSDKPRKYSREEFLAHVANELDMVGGYDDPEAAIRAVLQVISNHVSPGEVRYLRELLPSAIKSLWPSQNEENLELEAAGGVANSGAPQ